MRDCLSTVSYPTNVHSFVTRSSEPKLHPVKHTRTSSITQHPSLKTSFAPRHLPAFVKDAQAGLKKFTPELSTEGSGGTYFIKNVLNQPIAVFKPQDEDPLSVTNPKKTDSIPHFKGILPGEGVAREILAFQIDSETLKAGVPETMMATISGWSSDSTITTTEKTGSLQQFVSDIRGNSDEFGSSLYSAAEIHRIAVLDLLLVNCDRNSENLLVQGKANSLVPIDHAFCLPDYHHIASDLLWFEWMNWRQSKQMLSTELKEFIRNFDIEQATLKARALLIREDCIRTMQLAHSFLVQQIENNDQITPFDLGKAMCSSAEPSLFVEYVNAAVPPPSTAVLAVNDEPQSATVVCQKGKSLFLPVLVFRAFSSCAREDTEITSSSAGVIHTAATFIPNTKLAGTCNPRSTSQQATLTPDSSCSECITTTTSVSHKETCCISVHSKIPRVDIMLSLSINTSASEFLLIFLFALFCYIFNSIFKYLVLFVSTIL